MGKYEDSKGSGNQDGVHNAGYQERNKQRLYQGHQGRVGLDHRGSGVREGGSNQETPDGITWETARKDYGRFKITRCFWCGWWSINRGSITEGYHGCGVAA